MLLISPLCGPVLGRTVDTFSQCSHVDSRRARSLPSHNLGSKAPSTRQPGPSQSLRPSVRAAALSGGRGSDAPVPKEVAERQRELLKYVREVQPAAMERFVDTGPAAVVGAMRATITNMLGTLPPQFFSVTVSTVGENLAQLMYSVMMTGYLFRNAQYRLELRSLAGTGTLAAAAGSAAALGHPAAAQVPVAAAAASVQVAAAAEAAAGLSLLEDDRYAPGVQKSQVQGQVLRWHKENGVEKMDAVEYINLLEAEVKRLRLAGAGAEGDAGAVAGAGAPRALPPARPQPQPQPLPSSWASGALQRTTASFDEVQDAHAAAAAAAAAAMQQQQQQAHGMLALRSGDYAGNEVLEYLRGLEAASLVELTACAGDDVREAMEAFVARLVGTGDKEVLRTAASECDVSELRRLFMWLMVVGFNLRTMECDLDVRGHLERAVHLQGGLSSSGGSGPKAGGGGGSVGEKGPQLPPPARF